LWIEHDVNKKMIFDDKVNYFICSNCNHSERLEFPFLATNTKKKIAVWYEPYHDPQIDEDIAGYAQMTGKDSFYAKAPRISDWNEFKDKISEMEAVDRPDSGVEFSDEFLANVSSFMKEKIDPSKKANYPKYLRHLQTVKGRILYAPVPFLVLAVFLGGITNFVSNIQRDFLEFIFVFLVSSIIAYCFYLLLHLAVTRIIPNWHKRKDLRFWSFGSLYWAIGVFLYVALFDPYNDGSWKYMDDWGHMFFTMIAPPIFIGSAIYIYQKYIK